MKGKMAEFSKYLGTNQWFAGDHVSYNFNLFQCYSSSIVTWLDHLHWLFALWTYGPANVRRTDDFRRTEKLAGFSRTVPIPPRYICLHAVWWVYNISSIWSWRQIRRTDINIRLQWSACSYGVENGIKSYSPAILTDFPRYKFLSFDYFWINLVKLFFFSLIRVKQHNFGWVSIDHWKENVIFKKKLYFARKMSVSNILYHLFCVIVTINMGHWRKRYSHSSNDSY